MYPRVMVRDCEDKTPVKEESSSYLVSYMESLSLEGHCSSRTTRHGGTSKSDAPWHAKNVKPPPRSSLSASPVSKAKNSKDVDVDITKHIRASSLPRPRAVLSSPENDEIIGNLNELNRKRETATVLEMQNHKNHAQGENVNLFFFCFFAAASKIPAKLNQLSQKGATPLKTRPLGQNRHAQVKVSPADVRLTTPRKTREIMLEGSKNTVLVEKPALDSLPKLRPTIRSRTIEVALDGCLKNNLREKSASDLAPRLKPNIRSSTPIATQGCQNNNLVEASELMTPRLRPSVGRVQGRKNNNLVEATNLTMPRLRPSVKRV